MSESQHPTWSPRDKTGIWLSPAMVLASMARVVGDNDGCNLCSYAFTYTLEGCDACAPITALLVAAGRGTTEDH